MTERRTEGRTDFSDLVRTRRLELGISLRELERRAVDPETGEQAKYGWISKVENGKSIDAPTAPRIRALAAGLGLPFRVIKEAVDAQFGLISEIRTEDGTARILVARIEEMTPDEVRQLEELASMTSEQRAQLLSMAASFRNPRPGDGGK